MSQLDSYEKRCQTIGGHQQLHQTIFLVILRQQSLQPPSKTQSLVKLRNQPDSMSGFDHLCWSCLEVLNRWLSLFLLAPQNIQSLEKSFCSRDPKRLKIQNESKKLLSDFFALSSQEDPQRTYSRPCQNHCGSTAPC